MSWPGSGLSRVTTRSDSILVAPALALAAALAGTGSSAARGAEADPPAIPPTITVTATRRAVDTAEHAGNTARIGRPDIRRVGHQHVSQIMYRAPGTWISRGSGQEHLTAIRSPVLTGPGACGAFLFLEDGVPIRPAGFCNVNELFEINTEQADAIEVVRGPGSVLYGSNAMHGLINVLSPRIDQTGQRFSLESGSDDFYRARFSVGTWDGRQGFRASGHASHDGGFRESSGYDQGKLNLGWRRDTGDRLADIRFSATRLQQETAGFILGEDAYKSSEAARSNPNPEAYRDADSLRLTGLLGRRVGPGLWLETRPYLRYSDMQFLQHFLPGQPTEKNHQTSAGALTSVTVEGAGGRFWIFGADAEYTDGHLEETQALPIEDGSDFLKETRPAGRHYDFNVEALMAAAYARLEQPLGPATRLNAGLRYERIGYDYDNRMLDGNTREDGTECGFGGCLFSRPADRDDSFDAWSPRLGLIHDLGSRHQVYLAMSRGFRAPQATELYRLQRQQRVADLDNEELSAAEAGWRYAGNRLGLELVGFAMEKKNFIFRDAEGFNRSDGETRHLGIEYSLRARLSDSWQLAADGTWARHTYRFSSAAAGGEQIEKGDEVDTAPRHMSSLRLAWDAGGSAGAELEWVSLGSYSLDAANTDRYSGHDLLHLSWRQNLGDRWIVRARIRNLTDTSYAERADLAFGNYRYFPGRPRSLFMELAWNSSE